MFFDTFFGMIFCQWFQKKTCKTNPTAFVPDYEHAKMCTVFNFDCYWACDNGLTRKDGIGNPNQAKYRTAYYVFPELHKIQDKSVSGRIAGHVHSVVPAILHPYFSGKSLRYGAMSLLPWDPAVTYDKAVASNGRLDNKQQPRLVCLEISSGNYTGGPMPYRIPRL